MFRPWWFSDFTITARSISSIVIEPTGGRVARPEPDGSIPATAAKSSISSRSRGLTSTARSTHWRSCRTLPGQGWLRSQPHAPSLTDNGSRP